VRGKRFQNGRGNQMGDGVMDDIVISTGYLMCSSSLVILY
jgi:hypothetical protein